MPIAQQTFSPSNSANFVYQPLLPTNVGPLNPPTVTFSPNSYYVTQPSNVQPFSSGGTIFYVGDPKALDAAIYSKPLMAPYTNENKQYGPIMSSGSKPITNQDLAEILTLSQKGSLPEWKLSSFDGSPLQWPEWFGQFKSAIDAKVLSDNVKLTYLKTLVSGNAKNAIADFAYSGVFYKDILKTLERKFGQPQTIVAAHLEKFSNFPPLKMHNSDSIISFTSCISSLVAVLKSLGYEYDLKSTSVLNQVISKLPPNMKESWSLHSVKKCWRQPTVLDFNDWLRDKAEAHELIPVSQNKSRPEETPKTGFHKPPTKVFAAASKLKNHFLLRASSARVNIHSGVDLCLRKRPQLNELISQHKIGCVLLAFNLTPCSENDLKPANALSLVVKAPIMSFCIVLRKFSA